MANLIINGQALPYPKKFELQKVPNIVCEIETMSGRRIADVNGWHYADTTIEWGSLYPEDLQKLVTATAASSFRIIFIDTAGVTQSVNAVLRGFKHAKTLARYGNDFVWENVSITVSFPDCYH